MAKLLKAIFLLIALVSMLFAQSLVRYIESEDDIRAAFYAGELSETEFLELLELYDDKVDLNGELIMRLAVIPDVTREELETFLAVRDSIGKFSSLDEAYFAFTGNWNTISPFVFIQDMRSETKISAKLFSRAQFVSPPETNEPYTAQTINLQSGIWKFSIKTEQDGKNSLETVRRALIVRTKNTHIIVGNFSEKFGCGLLFGKRVPLGIGARKADAATYVLYPKSGEANGFFGEFFRQKQTRMKIALSRNAYGFSSIQHVAALEVKSKILQPNIYTGIVLLASDMGDTNAMVSQNALSLFFNADYKYVSLQSECGIVNNAFGMFGAISSKHIAKTKLTATIWSYGKKFAPFYSAAPGDGATTQDVMPDEISFSLLSKHAAESGVAMNANVSVVDMFKVNTRATFFANDNTEGSGGEIFISATHCNLANHNVEIAYSLRDRLNTNGTVRHKTAFYVEKVFPFGKTAFSGDWAGTQTSDIASTKKWTNAYSIKGIAEINIARYICIQPRCERHDADANASTVGYWKLGTAMVGNFADRKAFIEIMFRKNDTSKNFSAEIKSWITVNL